MCISFFYKCVPSCCFYGCLSNSASRCAPALLNWSIINVFGYSNHFPQDFWHIRAWLTPNFTDVGKVFITVAHTITLIFPSDQSWPEEVPKHRKYCQFSVLFVAGILSLKFLSMLEHDLC